MPNLATSPAATTADKKGWETSQLKDRSLRANDGQFFTPLPIALSLASWFSEAGLNRRKVHLLDPGAGGGVLTAAFVDKIVAFRKSGKLSKLDEVTLEAWEMDADILPDLQFTLEQCQKALDSQGVRTSVEIKTGNFVTDTAKTLDNDLFVEAVSSHVTHSILNPPYKKLNSQTEERVRLSSVGIETSNLYSAFVCLAFRHLVEGGELAAITPRSFCNGPYFREFRRELLREGEFTRLHVFDSRTEAFGRDKVLQENVLYHLVRQPEERSLTISISTGSVTDPATKVIPRDQFFQNDDPELMLHIAPEADALEIREFFAALPCKISDLSIDVSTGPVVDFRLRDQLEDKRGSRSVPLIYPHCVNSGSVCVPLKCSGDYSQSRIKKKAVAIKDNGQTRKWLLATSTFVLVKRFSSKEEKRRIVAGVLDPKEFSSDFVGIENHLNFFHRQRKGIPKPLAKGLCRFLNSTISDRYFRQFNGHTQVNATDLRLFKYPDSSMLSQLGDLTLDDTNQVAVDEAMTEILGAPLITG